ncbi:MAG: lipopolysaccharide heptosyltransferase II [Legionellales bacterium]|nr:lipopolysaccharide heptosyltransferase II [Legionellales bacterium]
MNNNILIIGPAWIGDMVIAQSLYRLLKQRQPEANIDVIAPSWCAPLLSRMPEIRACLEFKIAHGKLGLAQRYQFAQQLKKNHYQQAIILPNSFKSALIPWLAKIPQRRGYRGECRYGLINDRRLLNKKKYPSLVERFALLASPANTPLPATLPWPALTVDKNAQALTLKKYHLATEKPILILCPGAAYGPAKRWPISHFAEVANDYLQRDWQVWLLGGKAEKNLHDQIQSACHHRCQDLSMTSLTEAIDLMALANLIISNDSGLMHIAASVARPLIAIYGSSDPHYTPPLSQHAHIVSLELSCSPCFQRECPLHHLNCLQHITPHHIITTANNLV